MPACPPTVRTWATVPPEQPRPAAGVDPTAIEDAAGFAAALTELRAQVALTIREVSRRTGIPSATLGGYFSGRHLPPPTQPAQLAELLTALGVPDGGHEEWRAALNRVRRIPGPADTPARWCPTAASRATASATPPGSSAGRSFVDQLHEQVGGLFDERRTAAASRWSAPPAPASRRCCGPGLMARLAMEGVTPVLLAPGTRPATSAVRPRWRASAPTPASGWWSSTSWRRCSPTRSEPIVREDVPRRSLVDLAEQSRRRSWSTALRADFYGHAVEDPTLLPMLRQPPGARRADGRGVAAPGGRRAGPAGRRDRRARARGAGAARPVAAQQRCRRRARCR